MGGAVLAYAYRIVRHYVDYGYVHQRAHPYSRLHIVGKGEEGGAKRLQAAVKLYAVAYRRHRVLAYAVMNVASQPVFGREVINAFKLGLGGGGKVCRTRHYVGHNGRNLCKHLAAARTGGLGRREVEQPLDFLEIGLDSVHKLLVLRGKLGEFGLVLCKHFVPRRLVTQFFVRNLLAVLLYVVGHGEGFFRPAEEFLHLCKVSFAHRRSVHVGAVGKGRAVADYRVAYD